MTPDKNVVEGTIVEDKRPLRPELWIEVRQVSLGSGNLPCAHDTSYATPYKPTSIPPGYILVRVPAEGSAPPPEVDAVEENRMMKQILHLISIVDQGCGGTLTFEEMAKSAMSQAAACLAALRAAPKPEVAGE